jgi:hypothetical protein
MWSRIEQLTLKVIEESLVSNFTNPRSAVIARGVSHWTGAIVVYVAGPNQGYGRWSNILLLLLKS